jgi:hypothetical protein
MRESSLRKVDFLQTAGIIECHVTNLSIGTQGHLFQACSKGEGILTDHGIIANGQRFQSGAELIIEVLFATLIVIMDGKSIILIH